MFKMFREMLPKILIWLVCGHNFINFPLKSTMSKSFILEDDYPLNSIFWPTSYCFQKMRSENFRQNVKIPRCQYILLWMMTLTLILFFLPIPIVCRKEVRWEIRLVLPERPESPGLADTLLPDSHHPLVLRPAHIRLTTPRYYQIQPCPAQARVEHSHWSRDIELMWSDWWKLTMLAPRSVP